MGSQQYSVVGYGFNVQEARRDAVQRDLNEHGHEEGYNGSIASARSEKVVCIKKPKISKRCKVEKEVQKGTRKWETVFVLEPRYMHDATEFYMHSKRLSGVTQGKAIKEAKALALKHQCSFTVTIEKKLVEGNSKIAEVVPAKSEAGAWRFSGWARC